MIFRTTSKYVSFWDNMHFYGSASVSSTSRSRKVPYECKNIYTLMTISKYNQYSNNKQGMRINRNCMDVFLWLIAYCTYTTVKSAQGTAFVERYFSPSILQFFLIRFPSRTLIIEDCLAGFPWAIFLQGFACNMAKSCAIADFHSSGLFVLPSSNRIATDMIFLFLLLKCLYRVFDSVHIFDVKESRVPTFPIFWVAT